MRSTATLQSIWVNLLHRVIVFYDVLNCCLVSKVMSGVWWCFPAVAKAALGTGPSDPTLVLVWLLTRALYPIFTN